jgi:hypothetical protein
VLDPVQRRVQPTAAGGVAAHVPSRRVFSSDEFGSHALQRARPALASWGRSRGVDGEGLDHAPGFGRLRGRSTSDPTTEHPAGLNPMVDGGCLPYFGQFSGRPSPRCCATAQNTLKEYESQYDRYVPDIPERGVRWPIDSLFAPRVTPGETRRRRLLPRRRWIYPFVRVFECEGVTPAASRLVAADYTRSPALRERKSK